MAKDYRELPMLDLVLDHWSNPEDEKQLRKLCKKVAKFAESLETEGYSWDLINRAMIAVSVDFIEEDNPGAEFKNCITEYFA